MKLRKGELEFNFFTLLTCLGTPYDITLHDLRIECFFAAGVAFLQRRRVREKSTNYSVLHLKKDLSGGR